MIVFLTNITTHHYIGTYLIIMPIFNIFLRAYQYIGTPLTIILVFDVYVEYVSRY